MPPTGGERSEVAMFLTSSQDPPGDRRKVGSNGPHGVGGVVAAGCARTDRPSTAMVLAEAGRSDLPGRAATAHD
jgi:hypothetical protein